MTKSLLDQARELIICALHPGKTYEEALEEEVSIGCIVFFGAIGGRITGRDIGLRHDKIWLVGKEGVPGCISFSDKYLKCPSLCTIIGLPITLGRLMQAYNYHSYEMLSIHELRALFDEEKVKTEWGVCRQPCVIFQLFINNKYISGFKWTLTKEDGFTEATLEDQSEETWSAIIQLLS